MYTCIYIYFFRRWVPPGIVTLTYYINIYHLYSYSMSKNCQIIELCNRYIPSLSVIFCFTFYLYFKSQTLLYLSYQIPHFLGMLLVIFRKFIWLNWKISNNSIQCWNTANVSEFFFLLFKCYVGKSVKTFNGNVISISLTKRYAWKHSGMAPKGNLRNNVCRPVGKFCMRMRYKLLIVFENNRYYFLKVI